MNVGKYIAENYEELCAFAKRYTRDNYDLVNHLYLKCHDKEADNPFMYLKTSFWREANISKESSFIRQYTYNTAELEDVAQQVGIEDELIQKDRIDFHLMNCDEFDREIFRIYCDGYNMERFSKESGIPKATIDVSIKKTKQYLKERL